MHKFNYIEKDSGKITITGSAFVFPYALALHSLLKKEGCKIKDIPKQPFSSEPSTHYLSFNKHDITYDGIYGGFNITNKNKWGITYLYLDLDPKYPKHFYLTMVGATLDKAKSLMEELSGMFIAHNIFQGSALSISSNEGLSFFKGSSFKPMFSEEVEKSLDFAIFSPIKYREELGPDFKRGVLLSGSYGMGKSLVASYTAHLAEKENITYIFCKEAGNFTHVTNYMSAIEGKKIIFVEDIDKLFLNKHRDEAIDDILNTLDSVDTKDGDTLYIFTTNDIAVIERAMLRPGRIDSIVTMELPNPNVMRKILNHYTKGEATLAVDTFMESLPAGQRYSPAILKEICVRAMFNVKREQRNVLTVEDLMLSLESLKYQIDLLYSERPVKTKEQVLYESVQNLVKGGVHEVL